MSESTAPQMSDAKLARRIHHGGDAGRSAAQEIIRRHRAAVLAYAVLCCNSRKAAEDLTQEALARMLQEVRQGHGPSSAWRPCLVASARRTAARWADTGREAVLSAGFRSWLEGLPGTDGAESAATAAEENSDMLRAFRMLDETSQAAVWHIFVERAENEAPLTDAGPDTPCTSDALDRQHLYEAYLRAYAAQAPSRACRHLIAVMDGTVRSGACDRAEDLDQHTADCESCSRVRAEITAIHTGQHAVVCDALLRPTANRPTAPSREPAVAEPAAGTATAHDARRILPGSRAAAAALRVTAAAMIVAVATVVTSTLAPQDTAARASIVPLSPPGAPKASPTAPAPNVSGTAATATVPGTPGIPTAAGAVPPLSGSGFVAGPSPWPAILAPAPLPRTSGSPAVRPVAPPLVNDQGPAVSEPKPSVGPPGFQLVNTKSGLCVGVEGDSGGDGAQLQLQQCTSGNTTQRWERTSEGGNTYRLHNVGTGKCLDGTRNGGNVVRVVQWECHITTDRDLQQWTFEAVGESSYRLWYVPQVSSSDYSSHLFGPEDWWDANDNPPKEGSYLAQLPNYYNSDSFLVAMK